MQFGNDDAKSDPTNQWRHSNILAAVAVSSPTHILSPSFLHIKLNDLLAAPPPVAALLSEGWIFSFTPQTPKCFSTSIPIQPPGFKPTHLTVLATVLSHYLAPMDLQRQIAVVRRQLSPRGRWLDGNIPEALSHTHTQITISPARKQIPNRFHLPESALQDIDLNRMRPVITEMRWLAPKGWRYLLGVPKGSCKLLVVIYLLLSLIMIPSVTRSGFPFCFTRRAKTDTVRLDAWVLAQRLFPIEEGAFRYFNRFFFSLLVCFCCSHMTPNLYSKSVNLYHQMWAFILGHLWFVATRGKSGAKCTPPLNLVGVCIGVSLVQSSFCE